MKCRYIPNNVEHVAEAELYMLPGLEADFSACRISGVTISRITFPEFHLIEESQFAADLMDSYAYNRSPYYCVFTSNTGEEPKDGVSQYRAELVNRIARSLWLYKES